MWLYHSQQKRKDGNSGNTDRLYRNLRYLGIQQITFEKTLLSLKGFSFFQVIFMLFRMK